MEIIILMKKAIFFIAILVVGVVFLFQLNKKELIIGVTPSLPPFVYLGGANKSEVMGFDLEIAKEIAKDRNQKIELRILNFSELLTAVSRGDIDMAIGLITVTDEREQLVDFSNIYFTESTITMIRKNDSALFENITTKEELGASGKKIAVMSNTLPEQRVREVADQNDILLFKEFDDVVAALLDGRADALVITTRSAQTYIKKYDELMILPELEFYVANCAAAVKKGNKKLIADINKTLNKLQTSGKYDEFVIQYLNAEL